MKLFHLTIFSHQPVGTLCSLLYLWFNLISTLTDFEGWCYVLWLNVAHAVRMGNQRFKCEKNPRDYNHTQNATTMQHNPGSEQLSEWSLIAYTLLCKQGHANSFLNYKMLKWGLGGLLLREENKPQLAKSVSWCENPTDSNCFVDSSKTTHNRKTDTVGKRITQPYCCTICFGHSGKTSLKMQM